MDPKVLVKATPKPLLLKDYLFNDLSSCSSSGFRTYPRRQCCTPVRFLLEIDMKTKQAMPKKKSTKSSALQKASEAVINAVKHLGYAIVKSTTSSSSSQTMKISTLSRNLSRKILKRGFWKKNYDHPENIERWNRFIEEVKSDDSHQSKNCSHMMKKEKIIMDSNSLTSERVGADCDSSLDATTTNTATTTNSTNSTKSLINEEEKEQFSPVCVLACPFDDEDEVSSSFQHRLPHVEGSKKNLFKKLHRFELLAELEPLNLETRLAFSSESDRESIEYPQLPSSYSLENFKLDTEEENEEPLKLVHLIKPTMPSCGTNLKADKLLVDFFKERITDGYAQSKDFKADYAFGSELLSAAKDWINGKHREFSVEWDVQKNRQGFIRDMEGKGEWKTLDREHNEMASELEGEIFASLLKELLDDICFHPWRPFELQFMNL